MASNQEFVEYVCEQIKNAGDIAYKKMFGEYGVYCNGKVIGLVCDNMFYVKKTKNGALVIGECEEASPYTNAKPHFLIDDIDHSELITKLVVATYNELPEPKPKKKKQLL